MSDTASPDEIARFSRLAPQWWDENGPMRPLHRMNPVRVGWVQARIDTQPGGGPATLLDVGCGAGIASEAFARRGHRVTGLDASAEALEVARQHARAGNLTITYRLGVAEDLIVERQKFPVITALEVIEHVPGHAAFIRALSGLLRPNGILILSTINRTLRSLAVAKIGAEYIARLLPAGTHDWRAFVTPGELASLGREAGLRLTDLAGMSYAPASGTWRISQDVGINYIAAFTNA